MLYKYPQRVFPYSRLDDRGKQPPRPRAGRNTSCSTRGFLTTTGTSTCFVEYAKASPGDILMRVTAHNRGRILRRCICCHRFGFVIVGSGGPSVSAKPKPVGHQQHNDSVTPRPTSATTGCYCDGAPELLFCENETNARRLYGSKDATGPFKDAFHDYVVGGRRDAVSKSRTGTKAATYYHFPRSGRRVGCKYACE